MTYDRSSVGILSGCWGMLRSINIVGTKFPIRLLIALPVVLFAGCASSPLSTYPRFPDYKLNMTAGALLADCVVVDDMIGDTNKIDVIANKSLGGMLLTYFTDRLTDKGYHIDNAVLTSVGMFMDRQHVYKLAESIRSEGADVSD